MAFIYLERGWGKEEECVARYSTAQFQPWWQLPFIFPAAFVSHAPNPLLNTEKMILNSLPELHQCGTHIKPQEVLGVPRMCSVPLLNQVCLRSLDLIPLPAFPIDSSVLSTIRCELCCCRFSVMSQAGLHYPWLFFLKEQI